MDAKAQSADDYNARMDRMVQGLKNKTKTANSRKRKDVVIWTSVLLGATVAVLTLLALVQSNGGFAGKFNFF